MNDRIGVIGAVALGLMLIVGLFLGIMSVERVPNGYVGVVYSVNGGLQDETLPQGWHMVSPGKRVELFTVSNEQLLLTKDKREGSEEDESFKVATLDNASMAISFQMTYRFKADDVVQTYKSFKMGGESIVNNRVRTVLKSKVSEVTTSYSLMDIYSGDRATINNKITDYLNQELGDDYGLEVIDASIIDVHPDEKLQTAIDNRVEAQQKADQAKAEQQTAKVEAETEMLKAKNKADIEVMDAEAEAEANKVLSESITDELIRMKEAEARYKHGWVTVTGADTVVKE